MKRHWYPHAHLNLVALKHLLIGLKPLVVVVGESPFLTPHPVKCSAGNSGCAAQKSWCRLL